jgi:hypothetical protein
VVHPATLVFRGGYNETCAALGRVPKQGWSVPVAQWFPKLGCTAPGGLEVCHSKGVGHLFTIEVILDWTLGNWYQVH